MARGIQGLFSVGKLELEKGIACSELTIYPRSWIYSWYFAY